MKNYIAAPPETLMVDEKHLRQYYILNRCGVVITTNYKMDGIYLPADDRRHYVAWSERAREEQRFVGSYWSDLYEWYREGGNENVAAFLMKRDIGRFDAKAPPQKTEAFWAIADANRAPEEAELADLLDKLDHPNAISLRMLQGVADDIGNGFADWVQDVRNRRAIPHRMGAVQATRRCAIPMRRTGCGSCSASARRCTPNAACRRENRSPPPARLVSLVSIVSDLSSPFSSASHPRALFAIKTTKWKGTTANVCKGGSLTSLISPDCQSGPAKLAGQCDVSGND